MKYLSNESKLTRFSHTFLDRRICNFVNNNLVGIFDTKSISKITLLFSVVFCELIWVSVESGLFGDSDILLYNNSSSHQ